MEKASDTSSTSPILKIARKTLIAGIATFAAASFALPSVSAAANPALVIHMSDKPPKFMPSVAKIKAGQTIQWVNDAKTLHSVDADKSMVQNPSDVVLPAGVKPFDSGFMQPGATFEHTFTQPGVYKYTCVPHEKDHMNGEVDVSK